MDGALRYEERCNPNVVFSLGPQNRISALWAVYAQAADGAVSWCPGPKGGTMKSSPGFNWG